LGFRYIVTIIRACIYNLAGRSRKSLSTVAVSHWQSPGNTADFLAWTISMCAYFLGNEYLKLNTQLRIAQVELQEMEKSQIVFY